MPLIVCNTRAGLDVELKKKIAYEITEIVHKTIKAEHYHISVIFNDLPSESSYVGGVPGADTVIMCTIRQGRSETAIRSLTLGISSLWHNLAGQDEAHIEVGVHEVSGQFVVRAGKFMGSPPIA